MTKIYIDMDGTIARPNETEKNWFKIPANFRNAEKIELSETVKEIMKMGENVICTAICACKNSTKIHQAKIEWIAENYGEMEMITIMTKDGSCDKSTVADAENNILIDDNERNCRLWQKAKGTAIQVKNGNVKKVWFFDEK